MIGSPAFVRSRKLVNSTLKPAEASLTEPLNPLNKFLKGVNELIGGSRPAKTC
jgi:hypothetical protein